MPVPFLLIDGYNLMHAAGIMRLQYGPGGLERSRNRFLRFLVSRLDPDELGRTTVVFDAANAPPGAVPRATLKGMQIIFAASDGDADALIEELLAAHSAPRQMIVVSSDHRLQKAARRRRARALDSETYYRELQRRPSNPPDTPGQSPPPPNPKFGGPPSDAQTDYWMHVFGDFPEADELQRQLDHDDRLDLSEFDFDLDDDPCD